MATKPKTTEALVTMPRALSGRGFDTVKEVIQTNLGANSGLSFSDLTKISMPAGGGTIWEIPTSDGGHKNEEVISGVVVAFQDGKAYWKDSLEDTGGGTPPDCRSTDMLKGEGTPGILCSECPHNEFGSALKGIGKACKDLRVLYILSGDSLLPKVVVVPPTSLKGVRKAFLALAVEDETPYYGALLNFKLEKDKNAAGISYSKIVVSKEALLTDEDYRKAQAYNEMLKPMLGGMTVNVIDSKQTYSEDASDEG